METNAVGIGPLSNVARNMFRGPRFAGGGRVGGYSQKNTPRPVNAPEESQPFTLTREDGELLLDLTPIIGDIKGGVEGAQVIIQELKAENPNWLLIGVIGGATVAGMIPLVGVGAKKLMMKGANKFKKDEVLEETLNMLPEQDAALVETLTNRSASYKFGLTDTDQNRDIATAFEEMVEDNKDLYTEDVYHFTKGTTRSVGDDVLTGGKFDSSGGNNRFNRLGTHVGNPDAANHRSSFFLGPNNDSPTGGGVMPLRARVDKPLLNSSGEVFDEEDIIPLMNRYADDNKIADLDIAADMFRQELTDQGYTHIPYTNNVEGRDELGERTISHVMLTNRTAGDPAVLKGKFGAFEDVYDPRLMKAEGGEVMQGVGSLNETARNMFRGPRGIGAYQQFAEGGEAGGYFERLAQAVMMTESAGDPNAVSRDDAIGLMQILPTTAVEPGFEEYGAENVFDIAARLGFNVGSKSVEDARELLFNPEINLEFGRKYLRAMLNKFPSEQDALRAYNAGPGTINKYINAGRDLSSLTDEAQQYPIKVVAALQGVNPNEPREMTAFNQGPDTASALMSRFSQPESDVSVATPNVYNGSAMPLNPMYASNTLLRPRERPQDLELAISPVPIPRGRPVSFREKYGLPGDMPEGGVASLSTASGLR